MNRTNFINSLYPNSIIKNYLEIGVRNGENFFSIKYLNKIGIDPDYFFSKRFLFKSCFKFHNWKYKM